MRLLLSLSDTELIQRFHNGQERAFDVLFLRYKEDVRKVVVHVVKDRRVAEDLSQDAFMKIYTSLKEKKYNEQGKFRPWALRVVRNLCMDYLRKIAQQPPSAQVAGDDCLAEDQTAESKLIAKQRQWHLANMLSRLPDDQRKVVCYRYLEERSFKEIALLMNTSVNTSLGRMRYGLAHLRKQLPSYSLLHS